MLRQYLALGYHRFLHLVEGVAADDAAQRPQGAGAVVAGADENTAGEGLNPALYGIEGAVQEVLHRPGHVAEVLRGADEDAVRPQEVVRAGILGLDKARLDLLDERIGCPFVGGKRHAFGVARLRVIDDEQVLDVGESYTAKDER